jgi:enoyl-CoA hydratase/carnithine racemase
MKGHVKASVEAGIMEVVFDRPQKKNAVSVSMYNAINEHLAEASDNPGVRVVVFRGSGGNFTSGNDLKDFIENPPDGPDSPVFRFLRTLLKFPKPLLAAIEGYAIGLGTTMLLHFDLAYAAQNAVFRFPFVGLGLVPEAGSSYLLPRTVGDKRANELLFFAERFDAGRALEIGLINEIFGADEVYPRTMERARKLASQPSEALVATKRLLRAPLVEKIESVMANEGVAFMERLVSEEFMNAARSLLDKPKA